jgi:hypothetical protein
VASFDSADCLAQFNEITGRPATDEITTASKYARLARGQVEVLYDIAAVYPQCLYRTAGPTATTTTGGIVHTFGTDAQGNAVAPLGQVWIGRSTSRYPDPDLLEGVDYMNEGTQIRMLNERSEPTLYWMGIPTPADISASVEPSLRPAPARRLFVIKAAETFGREGQRDLSLADDMERLYAREFAKHMQVFRSQFRNGGAMATTDPWNGATKTLR